MCRSIPGLARLSLVLSSVAMLVAPIPLALAEDRTEAVPTPGRALPDHRPLVIASQQGLLAARVAPPAPTLRRVGWGPGERMTFLVSLAGVRGGRAALSVGEVKVHDDEPGYLHIRGLGETVPFISTFSRMREDVTTRMALADGSPIVQLAVREMPGKDRRLETRFEGADQVEQTVTFAGRTEEHKRSIPGPRLEAITLLYGLRSLPLPKGRRMSLTVVNGTSLMQVDLRVKGRERVFLDGKPHDAIRIDGHGQKVHDDRRPVAGSPPRRVSLWLSADRRRVPLKLWGETALGDLEAVLTSYKAPSSRLRLGVAGF